jgi:hypothetical protein
MPVKGLSSEYYYAIGMHLALLGERIAPDWAADVVRDADWIIGRACLLAGT